MMLAAAKAGVSLGSLKRFEQTHRITDNAADVELLYRLMCFNVFIGNRDDHSKNFSYLYDEESSAWRLAPAYDLTAKEPRALASPALTSVDDQFHLAVAANDDNAFKPVPILLGQPNPLGIEGRLPPHLP